MQPGQGRDARPPKDMLTKTRQLIEKLNLNDIGYCHWKSNRALDKALAGQMDVDLLVARRDATRFRTLLAQLCFKPVVATEGESYPSVEHYFALDEESGVLVHVHVYFRVITGETLAKNYRFPVEAMLLENTRELEGVRVPKKSAELLVFTLRMMLKHTSLVELVMLAREWEQVQQEVAWLATADTIDESVRLAVHWLPSLDAESFENCVTALKLPAPLVRRIKLGLQLRSRLRLYARRSTLRAHVSGVRKFGAMLWRRLTRSHKAMKPGAGGALIAFVGAEATGKSTLLAVMSRWLGEHFVVEQIHAGKPKSTWATFAPNAALPALRVLLPAHRSTHVELKHAAKQGEEQSQAVFPLLFAIRSVLLAYERRSLLIRAYRRAANGAIVLCDRYPSLRSGAPDSPQLLHFSISQERYPIREWLTRMEARLYRELPSPDLIVALSAPVEVAVLRNETRGKREPEDYVRLRHEKSTNLEFGAVPLCRIDTNQPLDQTVLDVKRAIWNAL